MGPRGDPTEWLSWGEEAQWRERALPLAAKRAIRNLCRRRGARRPRRAIHLPGNPRGRAYPAGAPLFVSKAVGKPPGPAFFEVASRGFSSKAPPAPSTLDPGPMAAVGCTDRANTSRALPPVVGASFRSFASPQAAKLTPSTAPLLPSRHCDSRARLARQSRRSFSPACFIRHWRRFAGELSPPNPLRSRWRLCRLTDAACPLRVLRWASAGAPLLSSQALPRLG